MEDEGDAALHTVAGPSDDMNAAAAMDKGRDRAADMRRVLNEQFDPQGVEITDVIITDVRLPDQIMVQMTNKTMVIAENASQKMTQEYKMLELKQVSGRPLRPLPRPPLPSSPLPPHPSLGRLMRSRRTRRSRL